MVDLFLLDTTDLGRGGLGVGFFGASWDHGAVMRSVALALAVVFLMLGMLLLCEADAQPKQGVK